MTRLPRRGQQARRRLRGDRPRDPGIDPHRRVPARRRACPTRASSPTASPSDGRRSARRCGSSAGAATSASRLAHGGGAFVNAGDPGEIGRGLADDLEFLMGDESISLAELTEARQIQEISSSRLAALRAGPAEVERIRELAERGLALIDDPDGFLQANLGFHMAISAATHNRVVHMWMSAIGQAVEGAMREATVTPDIRRHVAEQHVAIADAIARRDADSRRRSDASSHRRLLHRSGARVGRRAGRARPCPTSGPALRLSWRIRRRRCRRQFRRVDRSTARGLRRSAPSTPTTVRRLAR